MATVKRLLSKILLLALPFLAVYGFPFFVLLTAGELLPLSFVTNAQSFDHAVLLGLAYSNPVNSYKLQSANQRKAEVLAFGTSRVMQFRASFFAQPKTFYNAGGQYSRFSEYKNFVMKLEYSPRVLILGVEHWFFNEDYRRDHPGDFEGISIVDNRDFIGLLTRNWPRIYQDYHARKFTLGDLIRTHKVKRIGMRAIVEDAGFENDGSYSYGKAIERTLEDRLQPVIERIEKGTQQFRRGTRVSRDALRELAEVLELCAQRGIHVVAFLTPYPNVVWQTLMSKQADYQYMRELASHVKPLFDRHHFSFFDFSNVEKVGASEMEVVDGLHCSEEAYLRIFLEMQRRDPHLHRYSADERQLNTRLPKPLLIPGGWNAQKAS